GLMRARPGSVPPSEPSSEPMQSMPLSSSHCSARPRDLHSFPTRRSSDLHRVLGVARTHSAAVTLAKAKRPGLILADIQLADGSSDRKSTRLNSSHLVISYAVFCLTTNTTRATGPTPAHARPLLCTPPPFT